MSAIGRIRTWRDVRLESAFGGKAENICSPRAFPVWTLNGHSLEGCGRTSIALRIIRTTLRQVDQMLRRKKLRRFYPVPQAPRWSRPLFQNHRPIAPSCLLHGQDKEPVLPLPLRKFKE